MRAIFQVFNEQVKHFYLMLRLASYDVRSKYQSHYLGVTWQLLNPTLQIFIYWFVFGIGIRGGQPIDGVPFLVWLLVGLIPWFFISPAIIQGSNSIYTRISMVSKMKFPVSVLPTITILTNGMNFIFMLVILAIILTIYKVNPGIYLFQLPYYIFCLFFFIFSVTLFFSTISTIIRDFQIALQSIMRMMLYLTPILWQMDKLPQSLVQVLKLNPIYYLIEGFRNTFLSQEWFFQDWGYMLYFWCLNSVLLYIGANMHVKFRKHFVDYI